MKLSETKVLIRDLGILGVCIAQAIVNDVKQVMYSVPWVTAFPKPHMQYIGKGIPGITVVDSFEDAKAEILKDKGIFIFPDVGMGDEQRAIRDAGGRVFGSGESGELEFDRILFKKTLKSVGLATPTWGTVTGTDALEALLRKEKDLWIKLNTENRGIMETRHHENWEKTQGWFYSLVHDLGAFCKNDVGFMWEKPIPGVEFGHDVFMAQGQPFRESLYGWELKGDGYLAGHIETEKMPAPVKKIITAMAPIEKKYKTNGAISTEIRMGASRVPHFTDPARRFGNPPVASIMKIYKNVGEIIEAVADGTEIKPEWNAAYVAELSIEAAGADCESVPIELKDKDFEHIALRATCRDKKGMFWTIPIKEVGCTIVKCVGLGNTIEEAEYDCLEAAANFKCPGMTYDKSTFEAIEEVMKEGSKYGLPDL
jgi:hypothetical protein